MSKHPIPDWLRSQFSRIEDDVRKLGPCGVFTQMRTVTQTYFEQQVAAPQPPALGGEPIRRYDMDQTACADPCADGVWVKFEDIAPLQAEIDRLKDNVRWKAVADEQMKIIDQLKKKLAIYESFPGYLIDHCEGATVYEENLQHWLAEHIAALSKPAGSECCTPTVEEKALLAAGDCTPEELWGGSKPTCPKCIGSEK